VVKATWRGYQQGADLQTHLYRSIQAARAPARWFHVSVKLSGLASEGIGHVGIRSGGAAVTAIFAVELAWLAG
jgi:hypothetical protein